MFSFSSPAFRVAFGKFCVYAFCAAAGIFFPLQSRADQSLAQEYAVKAGFIYNLGKFISWPDKPVEASAGQNFLICYTGDVAMRRQLEELAGKIILGAVIAVVARNNIDAVPPCRILFVGEMSPEQLKQVLKSAGQNHILTVCDLPGFAEQGGMVNLYRKKNTIGLKINPKAISSAGLHISSKLLQLATIVGERD